MTVEPPRQDEILPAEIVADAPGDPVAGQDLDAVVFKRVDDFAARQSYRIESPETLKPDDSRVGGPAGLVEPLDVAVGARRAVASQHEPSTPYTGSASWRIGDLVIQGPPVPLLLFTLLLVVIALAL